MKICSVKIIRVAFVLLKFFFINFILLVTLYVQFVKFYAVLYLCAFLCIYHIQFENTKYSKKLPNCLLKLLYHFTFPLAMNGNSCSTVLSAFGSVSPLDFDLCNRYSVVSYCCFNLHFSVAIWWVAYFHILICHLHNFFSEVSVHLWPIFNYVFCFLIEL